MAASNQELSSWNGFQWRRKMEAFGDSDQSIVAVGAGNEIEGIWSVISNQSAKSLDLAELQLTT